jgi:selenide,water dikinase
VPGDILILTKPLGTGIIGTALKRGLEDENSARVAIESMAALNSAACEAMQEVGVHAATDVTGFGIAGHFHEMLEASGCAGEIDFGALPLLEGAMGYAAQGVVPGRTADVIEYAAGFTDWPAHPAPVAADPPIEDLARWRILCDPQTSGGLLIAVAPGKAGLLKETLESRGVLAAVIGHARTGAAGRVRVI